jgi:nicotinamide N-methyltransferase
MPTHLVEIKCIGEHPLWGNFLWNASKTISNHFCSHPEIIKDKSVFEFGAGGALPSLVCSLLAAKQIVITDYPTDDLLNNIKHNVKVNLSQDKIDKIKVEGLYWGTALTEKYDVIILSDLISNHFEHENLVYSAYTISKPETLLYVGFSHHRPWLKHKDMKFFEFADKYFKYELIKSEKTNPMFENDPGELEVRQTVYLYEMSLK